MLYPLEDSLKKDPLIIMEGAVIEILRRGSGVKLHPELLHAPLIYEPEGAIALAKIFTDYIHVAREAGLPFLMCAPTWRANKQNVKRSGIKESINRDAIKFMDQLRARSGNFAEKILIGGIIGPKNDCYSPEEGISAAESADFHAWQLEQLARGGADFIIAETLPTCEEALGMAIAASQLNIDYIISFVISRNGKILDGTGLMEAIERIDAQVTNAPTGYAVNCAHPLFLCADKQPEALYKRLVGFLANASSLDHCDLEGAAEVQQDDIEEWGNEMLHLNRKYGVRILGGCCGTDARHIRHLTLK